jgi:hypothetical protein
LLGVQQQALYLLTWTAGSMSWIDPGEWVHQLEYCGSPDVRQDPRAPEHMHACCQSLQSPAMYSIYTERCLSNWLSGSKLKNPQHHSYESLLLDIVMSQFHPYLILTTCFPKIHVNVILVLPHSHSPTGVPHQNSVSISHLCNSSYMSNLKHSDGV